VTQGDNMKSCMNTLVWEALSQSPNQSVSQFRVYK